MTNTDIEISGLIFSSDTNEYIYRYKIGDRRHVVIIQNDKDKDKRLTDVKKKVRARIKEYLASKWSN